MTLSVDSPAIQLPAHPTAMAIDLGYVWINEIGNHLLGAPFGGEKHSGLGREKYLEEMLRFTQQKNIHLKLRQSEP
jgi:betaine-aldehyde dehydrogenase